ncbi:hypothetical protein HG15A2_38140 [Adhaeretor mobilis]|uniref:Uncharacterized protein n=2 Tax=Adhaeretor mobilis TaxID=1930276 RepID=A0A517N019_9BACT|nr:hypothetical protein HG15A2_38140 [Adhaeretor mobilis]
MSINKRSSRFPIRVTMVAVMAICALPSIASAGTFSWGDIAGTDVMFLDVKENNDEATSLFAPMPGTGGPISIGNSLHLDPQGFSSESSNNTADSLDSQLSTVIRSNVGKGLESINISELGDYSLGGLTGREANASVGAAFIWTVLEVDGAAVNLATQATNLILGTGSGPNGGQYSRPGDDGTAVIWSGAANIDLAAYLSSLQINGSVTALRLTFDNTLQTSADDAATAFIKKKSIDIGVVSGDSPGHDVPEPTTTLLLMLGASLSSCRRWRR